MQKYSFEKFIKEWKFIEELTFCESVKMPSELKKISDAILKKISALHKI